MRFRKPFVIDERRSYTALFFVISVLFLLSACLAIIDELWLRRPWKAYQEEFALLNSDRLTVEYDRARDRLFGEEQEPAKQYNAILEQISDLEERARRPEIIHQREAVDRKRRQIDLALRESERQLQFSKSRYEAMYYELRHAQRLGSSTERLNERVRRIEDEIDRWRAGIAELEHEETLTGFPTEVAELKGLRKRLATLRRPMERLEARIHSAQTMPISVRQIVVPGFERNEFAQTVDRVDRCTSCHLGIEDALFIDADLVFRTHPTRTVSLPGGESADALLGLHPPDRSGCTTCHDGQGIATTEEDAHGWHTVGQERVEHWDYPMLVGNQVESNCNSCHSALQHIPGADDLNAGKRLFGILGCFGCHPVKEYAGFAKAGPSLRKLASKVRPEWLIRWIEDPRALHEYARMPTYDLRRDQALRIAAYLLAFSTPHERFHAPSQIQGNPTEGKLILGRIGCAACHTIDQVISRESRDMRFDFAPELMTVASKVRGPEWTYEWLLDPSSYNAMTRMPSFRLTETEASHVASYLDTLGNPLPPLSAGELMILGSQETVKKGRELIRLYGCFGCHDINGFDEEGRIAPTLDDFASKEPYELDFGNTLNADYEGRVVEETWESWTRNKLRSPRLYTTSRIDLRMPDFKLNEQEIDQLVVFLRSLRQRRITETYIPQPSILAERLDKGELLIEHFNCRGCHVIRGTGGHIRQYHELEALAPPNLRGEGSKVQSEWLFEFLKRPRTLRPWLTVRMPTFNLTTDQASTLVEFFYADANLQHLHDFDRPQVLSSQDRTLAKHVFERFKCLSCHQLTSMETQEMADLAPDLAMVPTRLKYSWVLEWIKNPQTVQPGTRMPTFFPLLDDDDPSSLFSPLPHIVNGDAIKQIELLASHVFALTEEERLSNEPNP